MSEPRRVAADWRGGGGGWSVAAAAARPRPKVPFGLHWGEVSRGSSRVGALPLTRRAASPIALCNANLLLAPRQEPDQLRPAGPGIGGRFPPTVSQVTASRLLLVNQAGAVLKGPPGATVEDTSESSSSAESINDPDPPAPSRRSSPARFGRQL